MASAPVLRPYRKQDLDAMFALDVACFAAPFRFSRSAMRRFAEARGALTLIAESATGDPHLVGFVILQIQRSPSGRSAYVVTLDVSPEDRRSGVGARLMQAAETLALEAEANSIALHVFTGNTGAIRFYEHQGYTLIAEHPNFYGASLDALVYRKELSAP